MLKIGINVISNLAGDSSSDSKNETPEFIT